jgi:hypothetical protein
MFRKNATTSWTTTTILLAGIGLVASPAPAQADPANLVPFDGFMSGPVGHSNQGTLNRPEHSNQGGDVPDPGPDPENELNYPAESPMDIGGVWDGSIADSADLWVIRDSRLPVESDGLVSTSTLDFDSFNQQSAPVAVPEPSGLMLIAFGLGCLARRRR